MCRRSNSTRGMCASCCAHLANVTRNSPPISKAATPSPSTGRFFRMRGLRRYALTAKCTWCRQYAADEGREQSRETGNTLKPPLTLTRSVRRRKYPSAAMLQRQAAATRCLQHPSLARQGNFRPRVEASRLDVTHLLLVHGGPSLKSTALLTLAQSCFKRSCDNARKGSFPGSALPGKGLSSSRCGRFEPRWLPSPQT